MAKWPGINDAKHVSKRVKPGTVVQGKMVEAHTLRVGDKIVEQCDDNGRATRYTEVNSMRETRRKVCVIVNGYLSYSRWGQVCLITNMYDNEAVETPAHS